MTKQDKRTIKLITVKYDAKIKKLENKQKLRFGIKSYLIRQRVWKEVVKTVYREIRHNLNGQ